MFAGMESAPVDPEMGAAVDPNAGAAVEPEAGAAVNSEASAAVNPEADALLSRLRVIEDQPLDTRAEAFTHLHDQLRQRLEGGDQPA